MRSVTFTLLCVLALAGRGGASALDITEPRATAENPKSSQIRSFTHASNSLSELSLFYQDGLGLLRSEPIVQSKATREAQRKLWGIDVNLHWQEYRFTRPGMPELAEIRALIFEQSLLPLHSSWNSLELGPMALGFPNTQPEAVDEKLRRLGFGAQGKLNQYEVPMPDGSGSYTIKETIFNGPDYSKAVSVYRGNGIALSPIDPVSQLGGPAYLSMVVADSEAMIRFLSVVLDYEVRADRVWTTSGALGAPIGTEYRFLILYAKGSRHGHILLLEYKNAKPITPSLPPRLPQRGLVMVSLDTPELDALLRRARHEKLEIRGPQTLFDSVVGARRVATIVAPNGFMFELREHKAQTK